MIKFDKNVHETLKALERKRFETYAVGDCVRDVLCGEPAYDWDLATRADLDTLTELFPEGEVITEGNAQFLRLDFTRVVPAADAGEEDDIEGVILDIHSIRGDMDAYLAAQRFSVNAMADNPGREFLDPYGGREDLRKKLIRIIGDPAEVFRAEPIRMMEAIRLASEMGFDLTKTVHDAIVANWRQLLHYDIVAIRDELERLLVSENAGKGLTMLTECGLMAVIFGEDIANHMSLNDTRAFKTVCANIDKTKRVPLRRMGLLFTVLSKRKALAAIERMQFDPVTKQHLDDAVLEMINIQFLPDEKTFKRYLFEHGMERFEYLHNLSKAMRIVYDQPTIKIESRNYLLKTLQSKHDPVFLEDLVIDSNDILEAGITDSPERAQELLSQVIAVVHTDPKNNQRDILLKTAKKYARNKFAAKTRYTRWLR